jgi:hypothetical protein
MTLFLPYRLENINTLTRTKERAGSFPKPFRRWRTSPAAPHNGKNMLHFPGL